MANTNGARWRAWHCHLPVTTPCLGNWNVKWGHLIRQVKNQSVSPTNISYVSLLCFMDETWCLEDQKKRNKWNVPSAFCLELQRYFIKQPASSLACSPTRLHTRIQGVFGNSTPSCYSTSVTHQPVWRLTACQACQGVDSTPITETCSICLYYFGTDTQFVFHICI